MVPQNCGAVESSCEQGPDTITADNGETEPHPDSDASDALEQAEVLNASPADAPPEGLDTAEDDRSR